MIQRARPAIAVLLAVLGACSDDAPREDAQRTDGRLVVYTVNYPLQYTAQRVGGTHVDVEFPAPPDVDPAFWKPERDILRRYQEADLILQNGAGYAAWTEMASLPLSRVIDTGAAFTDRYIEIPSAVQHAHGATGEEHTHAGLASTTWLDLKLAIEHARAIARAFAAAQPENRAEFDANFASLAADLEALDARLVTAAARRPSLALLGSHPVYQYLRRRYELNLRSVHWEPGDPITDAQWQELEDLRKDHDARVMLWEAEPLPASRERLVAAGIRSIVFAPCGNRPATGDLLDVLRANVTAFESIVAD